ncbi:MAG: hypothetical protein IKS48_01640 [Eubacterium sp.]|nr:hypothetical protein [Eubacterium sp.]
MSFNKCKTKRVFITCMLALTFALSACGKKEKTENDQPVDHVSVIGDVHENTVKISPNGIITEIAVEDYSDSDVDTSSVESYVKGEIDKFNGKRGACDISLMEIDIKGNTVRTCIQFNDIDTYNEFNGYNIQLTKYDPKTPDEIAKKEAAEIASLNDAMSDVDDEDFENISEEELEAAGYTLEDLERIKEERQGKSPSGSDSASVTDAVATFTDADGQNVVESKDISGETYMMLITDVDMKFVFNSGKVCYTNKHAEKVNDSSAHSIGDGKAVIVYDFGM